MDPATSSIIKTFKTLFKDSELIKQQNSQLNVSLNYFIYESFDIYNTLNNHDLLKLIKEKVFNYLFDYDCLIETTS